MFPSRCRQMSAAKKMTAQSKTVSREAAAIHKAIAELQQRVDDWSALDWDKLMPSEENVTAVRDAIATLDHAFKGAVDSGTEGGHEVPASDALDRPEFPEAKILLAEDNTVNRMVAEGMLRQFQCEIDMVVNGEEAVRRFEDEDYDLVFMDCQMPVMDGFDAVTCIREVEAAGARAREKRTPIVALTANALKGDRERCIEAGMDDYVSKPFSVADLQAVLERQLGVERTATIRQLRIKDLEELAARDTSPQNDETFVDAQVLDSIQRLTKTDGAKLLARVIDVFLETSPRLVDDLEAALQAGDSSAVARAAHALRSCCGSVGASRLATLCRSIESLVEQLSVVGPNEWLEQLAQCHKLTIQELQDRRARAGM